MESLQCFFVNQWHDRMIDWCIHQHIERSLLSQPHNLTENRLQMSKKQPYLREWESRMRWASEKSVVDKKKQKKEILQADRKRSIVYDQNNSILRDTILQKIQQNEHRYCTGYESSVIKIKVKIMFSKSYTLAMTLPSTMRVSELQQLIGCYIKLHLKHRPTEGHVYAGLESNRCSIMRMQESQLLEQQKQQLRQENPCQYQQKQQLRRLTSSVVTYITDSILLSDGYAQQAGRSLLQRLSSQTLGGSLMEIVAGHRLILRKMVVSNEGNQQLGDEVSLLVRYDHLYSTSDGGGYAATTPVQNNQLFTLDPDQHHQTKRYKLRSISPQHSLIHTPSHHKQTSFISHNSQLLKWFAETNIVKWLVVYERMIEKNFTCGGNQTIIPVRLNRNHNTKSIFHLTIINCHHHQPHQIQQKLQRITKCLISSELPLTQCVKEMYFLTKRVKQGENQSPNYSRQQFKYQQRDCFIVVVFETLQFKTVKLKEYLRQLLNNLAAKTKSGMNHNNCKRVCQCIRIDDPNYLQGYLQDHSFSHQIPLQTHSLERKMKRILAIVKSLCRRMVTLSNQTKNSNKKNKQSTESTFLLQGQSILDIFDILIHSSTTTQVLINTIAITKRICDHNLNDEILSNNCEKRDKHRRYGDGVNDKSLISNIGVQIDQEEQSMSLQISQRLIQQVLSIVDQLQISSQNQYYFSKLLSQSLLSPQNTHTTYSSTLSEHCHHSDYLKLITNQLHQLCEGFFSQLSKSSLRRIISDDFKTSNESKRVLSLGQKYQVFVETSLHQSQQQLSTFKNIIQNDNSHLQIDCLYFKPQVKIFLQNQNIDIYEKQTTLKKKNQPFTCQQNLNTKQNIRKAKQIKDVSTSEFDSNPNNMNKKNNNNKTSNNSNNANMVNKKKKQKTRRPPITSSLRK